MRSLISEVRFALRRLSLAPGFVLVSTLTLALGIGVSTAVFSVVDPLLIQTLPGVRNAEQLVVLESVGSVEKNDRWWSDAIDRFSRVDSVLAGALAMTEPSEQLLSIEGTRRFAWVTTVTDGFFNVLGLQAHRGHLFAPGDDTGAPSLVLGYDYWTREWNADEAVVGRLITIGGVAHTVQGVAPERFRGVTVGAEPDVYVALHSGNRPEWMQLMARLRTGVTSEQARAALELPFLEAVATSGIPAVEHPQALARLLVTPSARGLSPLRDRFGDAAWILMAMVTLLLLVACANVSNLVLARAVQRRHDFAVRRALGASPRRLIVSVLAETTVVATMGAGVGLLAALWAGPALVAVISTGARHVTLQSALDWRVLSFTSASLLLTMIVSGLLPALRAARANPAESLGARESDSFRSSRWPQALVVVQIGLSITLMSSAAMMARSLGNLTAHDVGFDAARVLAVSMVSENMESGPRLGDVTIDLMDRLPGVPGVESVGFASVTPISGGVVGVNVRSDDVPGGGNTMAHTLLTSVSPGYFQSLGITRHAGRDFVPGDEMGAAVAIVNQNLANRLFGATPAVGRRVRFIEGDRPPMTVIGVVADSTFGSLREEPQAALYSPARLVGARLPHATLVVRSRHERSDELASAVERAILAAAPSVAITEMRTFQTRITESVRGERVVAILIGGFGATALAVTVIGVFGVLAATMAHRTREIGLRIALGATSRQIARLVFVPAFALLAAGLGLGLVGALIAGRLVSTLLFGVEPADPLSLAIASGALALTVLAACVLPARRAARVDPSQLMRGC